MKKRLCRSFGTLVPAFVARHVLCERWRAALCSTYSWFGRSLMLALGSCIHSFDLGRVLARVSHAKRTGEAVGGVHLLSAPPRPGLWAPRLAFDMLWNK